MVLCGRQIAVAELISEFGSPLRRTGGENDWFNLTTYDLASTIFYLLLQFFRWRARDLLTWAFSCCNHIQSAEDFTLEEVWEVPHLNLQLKLNIQFWCRSRTAAPRGESKRIWETKWIWGESGGTKSVSRNDNIMNVWSNVPVSEMYYKCPTQIIKHWCQLKWSIFRKDMVLNLDMSSGQNLK